MFALQKASSEDTSKILSEYGLCKLARAVILFTVPPMPSHEACHGLSQRKPKLRQCQNPHCVYTNSTRSFSFCTELHIRQKNIELQLSLAIFLLRSSLIPLATQKQIQCYVLDRQK